GRGPKHLASSSPQEFTTSGSGSISRQDRLTTLKRRGDFPAHPHSLSSRLHNPTPPSEPILDMIHHRKDRMLCSPRKSVSAVNQLIVLASLTPRNESAR